MKLLALLALATLAALPLAAHDAWREPHRGIVLEAPRPAPYPRWEARRHFDHWEHRGHGCGWDRRDDRVCFRPLPGPLGPPFGARVELRFR